MGRLVSVNVILFIVMVATLMGRLVSVYIFYSL
jgi:hypothetical protein